MAFQFQCPQGHLLEGEISQAGQTCHCPTCGIAFIIPAPLPAQVEAAAPVMETSQPAYPEVGPGVKTTLPGLAEQPTLYHIPCPNGHELETPPDMFNQDVLCPTCGAQFRLRERDSVEFKRKQQEAQEKKDAAAGKAWFNWAVIIAVLVVIFMVALMMFAAGS
jgi:hypothetical protein